MTVNGSGLIIGNWKMYKTQIEADEYIRNLASKIADSKNEVILAVPFTAIHAAKEAAKKTKIKIAAQNMNDASEGAFTGEIAAKMLRDAGAEYVILGHSERRRYFGENDSFINRKVKKALEEGLIPILCIGENLEEHQSGLRDEVLNRQLKEGLAGVDLNGKELIIAYEPIWAIGTGITAGPKEAEDAHVFIRRTLEDLFGKDCADKIKILYGGSVKPENAALLLEGANVNGLLVGGASLNVDTFDQIINFNNQTTNTG